MTKPQHSVLLIACYCLLFLNPLESKSKEWASNLSATPTAAPTETDLFTSTDIDIPIDGSTFPHTSTIEVPLDKCIEDINVKNLDLTHSFIDDLYITLVSPMGTEVILLTNPCMDEDNLLLNLDGEAILTYANLEENCPPDDGQTYQPFDALSLLNGENAAGTWTLKIFDTYAYNDNGLLNGWQLEVTSGNCAVLEDCTNGVDDDGDGWADCEDSDCICQANCISEEQCGDGIDNDCDGLVDAYDEDCPCDESMSVQPCQVVCNYLPSTSTNFAITEKWASVDQVSTVMPLLAGEMDNDPSSSELFVMRDLSINQHYSGTNAFYIVDGTDGTVKYQPNTKSVATNYKGAAIADADRDGNTEFYFVISDSDPQDYRKIACYEFNPEGTNPYGTGTGTYELKWISSKRLNCGLDLVWQWIVAYFPVTLADFNYDGNPEVIVGNEIFDAQTGQHITRGGANSIGNFIYDRSSHEHFTANVVAIDVLPDEACANCRGLELVAGNQVYSVDISTKRMQVEQQAPAGLEDGIASIADYDLDGDLDGIVSMTDETGSYLYIWDLQSDTQIGGKHTITTAEPVWYRSVGQATLADFDGDQLPEIGVGANNVFQIIDDHTVDISGTNGLLWATATTDNSGLTSATAFDFNGDGVEELLLRDETSLRIHSGTTGAALATFPCASVTGIEVPIIVDLDHDDESEIVCSCGGTSSSYFGSLKAFRSSDYPWAPTRSIWNQYAYYVVNINDDMTIPIQQQQHHLVAQNGLGQTSPFNVFLKQISPFDINGMPFFSNGNSPTVEVQVDPPIACAGSMISFTSIWKDAGADPQIEWWVNGLNTGVTEQVFTSDQLEENDQVICMLKPSLDCLIDLSISSDPVLVEACNSTSTQGREEEIAMTILPNPTSGSFHVQLPQMEGVAELFVFDLMGKKQYAIGLSLNGQSQLIDLSSTPLAKGIYVVELRMDHRFWIEKLYVNP